MLLHLVLYLRYWPVSFWLRRYKLWLLPVLLERGRQHVLHIRWWFLKLMSNCVVPALLCWTVQVWLQRLLFGLLHLLHWSADWRKLDIGWWL